MSGSISHQFARHIVSQQPATQCQNRTPTQRRDTVDQSIRNERGDTTTRTLVDDAPRHGLVAPTNPRKSIKRHAFGRTQPQHDTFKFALLRAQNLPRCRGRGTRAQASGIRSRVLDVPPARTPHVRMGTRPKTPPVPVAPVRQVVRGGVFKTRGRLPGG